MPVGTVTDGALSLIQGLGDSHAVGARLQRSGPCDIIAVDENNSFSGIDGCAAPFGPAIVAGKNHSRLPGTERYELASAQKIAELLSRPVIHFR